MTKPSTTIGNDEPPSGGVVSDRSDVLVDHQAVEVEFNPGGVRIAGMSRTPSDSRVALAVALAVAVVAAGGAALAVGFVGSMLTVGPWYSYPTAVLAGAAVFAVYLRLTRRPRTATLVNKETGEAEAVLPVRPRPTLLRPKRRDGKRFTRG